MSKWKNFWAKVRNREGVGTAVSNTFSSFTPNSQKRREFVVIGLGRFGTSVAQTLVSYNHDVLAIDINEDRVQSMSSHLPHVVQLDATNDESLRQIGIGQFETGLVCISNHFEQNLLATTHLLDQGVNCVITKARTFTQKQILEKIGVHQVVLPEHEAGVHLGRQLSVDNFIDYIDIRDGISVVELNAPQTLFGNTLAECNLRQKLGLNVIAVTRGDEIMANLRADFRIQPGDVLLVIGRIEDAEKLQS